MAARTYIIRSSKQLAALASATRQDVMDVLAQSNASSAAELAATLGRPADAIYYHLRILERAGLVRKVGQRKTEGRSEALFRAVAENLRIDSEAVRRTGGKALVAIVGSMLRLGARDYGRALTDETVMLAGKRRELMAHRKTVWMRPQDLVAFNEDAESLTTKASGKPGRDRLYAVTILLTPLSVRRQRATRSTRSAKG